MADSTPSTVQPRRWFWPVVVGCLILQAVLAIDCARQWTPTHDEYWHLPIGLRMWTSGRLDDDVINPPPVRLWAALPLYLGGAKTGGEDRLDVGDIGDTFWQANGDLARWWFFLGRLMIIPLVTLTGLAIGLWARSWYGEPAAMVSVLLWTCCPTAIANAAIVTHDLPLAAAWTLAIFALVRFAENPTWRHALLFGLALGVAPLVKLTGIILAPLSLVLWVALRWKRTDSSRSVATETLTASPSAVSRRGVVARWAAALAVSLLVINACYLFRGAGDRFGSLNLSSSQFKALQGSSWLAKLPTPAPRDFVGALDRLAQDLERQHPVYLDGEWSVKPFARYYVAALCYKLSTSTLILIVGGVACVAWPRANSLDRRHGLFLLIAASVLPILASGSSNQIGIRYVLPTIPLLCILAGQSVRWLRQTHRFVRGLILLAIAGSPLALWIHPHHLAYFNAIAGGPANGRWHLVDSNIDWGQDLHALKRYVDRQHVNDIGLAYFGTVDPATVGFKPKRPPSGFPQPGWYAISVNFVQGRPHVLRDGQGGRVQVGLDEFGYFRAFEPVARIGYSIDVYRLTDQDVRRYAAALQQFQRESGR